MENDPLNELWDSQDKQIPDNLLNTIIPKAKKQRRGQYISTAVMSITVLILLAYTLYYAKQWDDFALGLFMMISSLTFRVILELITLYRKENQLVALDHSAFRAYLKRHYRFRLGINYYITPLCFAVYVIGFIKLLPYFKQYLSQGFYTYIVISGAISLLVLLGIVAKSVLKEQRFLKELKSK